MNSRGIRTRSAIGLALFFGPVALFVSWRGNFEDGGGIPCIIKAVTGFPCPGCGMTRSFSALSHLDVITSVRYNPTAIIVLLVVIAALIFPQKFVGRYKAINDSLARMSVKQHLIVWGSFLLLLYLLDIARVVTGFYPQA